MSENEKDVDIIQESVFKLQTLAVVLASPETQEMLVRFKRKLLDLFEIDELEIERVIVPSYDIGTVRITFPMQIVSYDMLLHYNDLGFSATDVVADIEESIEQDGVIIQIGCHIKAVLPNEDRLLLQQLGKIRWHFPTPGRAYETFAC